MRRLKIKKKPRFLRQQKKRDSNFILKTPAEVEKLYAANQIVAACFALLKDAIRPGVVLQDLDHLVETYILSQGAQSLYKGYRGNPPTHPPFPGTICASINQEICHGLPDRRVLRDGEIVGIDIGLRLNGFCGDACVTYAVGEVAPDVSEFLRVAEECLYVGIDAARPGSRLGQIGQAIEDHAHAHGYSVVREWGGHGICRDLHEPISVPHHGPADYGPILKPGMTFTIEPMINRGQPETKMMADGWTVETVDGELSAQFEHSIAITEDGARILSKLDG